jgi:hypothetical protein
LIVLGAVAALACISAIGAATTLVVVAMDQPAHTESGGCAVVAWKTGMTHCFRNERGEGSNTARYRPAVVVQAQAGPAR